MEQVGWSLVRDGAEINYWGDTLGTVRGTPPVIRLDNGDVVYSPSPGAIGDMLLVPRYLMYGDADSITVEIDRVIVVRSISIDQIVAERNRRFSFGFNYDFNDERGVHTFGTSKSDMDGWDDVTKLAQAAINIGQPDTAINISTNTGAVTVTAMEWQHIMIRAGQVRQPIWAASFILQAMSPIPDDFADDKYWLPS